MTDAVSRLNIDSSGDRLAVAGEIDAHSCPELSAALEPLPGSGDIRLDLSGVTFMDSSGLRVLIDAHQRAGQADRRVVITEPSASVMRVLEISGLVDHLDIAAS